MTELRIERDEASLVLDERGDLLRQRQRLACEVLVEAIGQRQSDLVLFELEHDAGHMIDDRQATARAPKLDLGAEALRQSRNAPPIRANDVDELVALALSAARLLELLGLERVEPVLARLDR